jgi:hypothetical protein
MHARAHVQVCVHVPVRGRGSCVHAFTHALSCVLHVCMRSGSEGRMTFPGTLYSFGSAGLARVLQLAKLADLTCPDLLPVTDVTAYVNQCAQ